MLTRMFKSGNSLAVRIPKELACLGPADEVEIERVGNTLVLRPVERETLLDISVDDIIRTSKAPVDHKHGFGAKRQS